MLSVMETIDRNLMPAASTLGARRGQAFWRIYFPLSLPGVAAAGLLVFITALGFFISEAAGRGLELLKDQVGFTAGGFHEQGRYPDAGRRPVRKAFGQDQGWGGIHGSSPLCRREQHKKPGYRNEQ